MVKEKRPKHQLGYQSLCFNTYIDSEVKVNSKSNLKVEYLHGIPRGSVGQQELDYIQVPVLGCIVKRGIILVPCAVHQGLVLEQQFHHPQVPMIACFMLIKQNE